MVLKVRMHNISKSICLRIIYLICISLSTTSIAFANVERRLTISDHPLAFNGDYMYFLRVVDDNLAFRDTHLEHHFLIKRDMKTNKVQKHWLVRQVQWSDEWDANSDKPVKHPSNLQEPPGILKGTSADASQSGLLFNPYDILREEGAVTISTLDILPASTDQYSWEIKLDEGVIYHAKSAKPKIDAEDTPFDVRISGQEFSLRVKEGLFSTIKRMKSFENEKYQLPVDGNSAELELGSCVPQHELLVAVSDAVRFLHVECEQFGTALSWFNTWVRIK